MLIWLWQGGIFSYTTVENKNLMDPSWEAIRGDIYTYIYII